MVFIILNTRGRLCPAPEGRGYMKIMVFIIPLIINAKPVEFSGSFSIYAEYDTLYNADQKRPSRITRLYLNPELKIYGMPLSLNILLSTEESSLRQELNKYRIFLSPSELLKGALPLPSLAFSISGIEIGRCYPSYSKFTLYSTPITGFSVEMNPGPIYIAGTGGVVNRAVPGSDSSEVSYKRTLYAGRFGIGKKEKTHLFFTLLYAKDDENSIEPYLIPYEDDSLELITPRENYIAGVELNLSLFNERFKLKAEIEGSQFTDDIRTPEISQLKLPPWLTKYTHPKLSSSFGTAYKTQFSIDLKITELEFGFERVEPSYRSLGNEYLRNDEQRIEATANQQFWEGILYLSEGVSISQDNLSGFNSYTTRFYEYNTEMGINIPNLPYLDINYTLYINKGEESIKENLLSLSSWYNFKIKGIDFSPSLFYTFQLNDSYTSNSLTLGQNVSFKLPLSFDIGVNWIDTKGKETSTLTGYSGSFTYTFFKRWSNSVGGGITQKRDERKREIWYSSSLDIGVFGNLELRVENNVFSSKKEEYNELRIAGSLSKTW